MVMSGDTNLAVATTTTSHRRSTEKENHGNTNDTSSRDDVIILLDELDEEIIHAEETDLMFKYYKELKEKVRCETRGQHVGKFHEMINSTHGKGTTGGTITSQKEGLRKIRKPSPRQQKQKDRTSKSSNGVVNDDAVPMQNSESISIAQKSARRQGGNRKSRPGRRPRLRLYDNIPTNGNGSAVLRNSFEMIHDLQLVQATILLPRIYSNPKATSTTATKNINTNKSTGSNVAITEWKKNELERYLYTKFWKTCLLHDRVYCRSYHPHDNDDDMQKNFYWKHFHIQLQSANMNSWRCIVTGYRTMVNDVLLFLQQLKLLSHHRNSNENKSASTASSALSTL